ncbi:MAG: alanine racemase, partial [Gammaproteobacteria bacterium]|nr:alanine racemase [Gammaproteobacteria bacterium]
MTHAARAYINIDALRHNLQRVRTAAPQAKILAIIKANGYGHDVVRIAKGLRGVDGFGVACLEEALLIRDAGIDTPILLLQGFSDADELPVIAENRLDTVVHHPDQITLLQAAQKLSPIRVWLKINTGMNRLGFSAESARTAWDQLQRIDAVQKPITLMSHFANADAREDPKTTAQLSLFNSLLEGIVGD